MKQNKKVIEQRNGARSLFFLFALLAAIGLTTTSVEATPMKVSIVMPHFGCQVYGLVEYCPTTATGLSRWLPENVTATPNLYRASIVKHVDESTTKLTIEKKPGCQYSGVTEYCGATSTTTENTTVTATPNYSYRNKIVLHDNKVK